MVIQGVSYLSDFEAKKAIIETARRLESKGFLTAGDGSLSVRAVSYTHLTLPTICSV